MTNRDSGLYIFLGVITFIFFLVDIFAQTIFAFIPCYLFVGLLIWIIGEGKTSLFRTLLLWYPAILLNEPDITY
jgi:hypothetical protein